MTYYQGVLLRVVAAPSSSDRRLLPYGGCEKTVHVKAEDGPSVYSEAIRSAVDAVIVLHPDIINMDTPGQLLLECFGKGKCVKGMALSISSAIGWPVRCSDTGSNGHSVRCDVTRVYSDTLPPLRNLHELGRAASVIAGAIVHDLASAPGRFDVAVEDDNADDPFAEDLEGGASL